MVDTSASDFGNIFKKQFKDTKQIKEEGFGNELSSLYQITPMDNLLIPTDTLFIDKQEIGTAFILSHPVNGRLSNATYTLGSGGLGSSSTIYVRQSNDVYVEQFGVNDLIDTSVTTATITNSLFKCEFADGTNNQVLQTKSLYFDASGASNVSKVTLILNGIDVDNGSFYVSTNGGSTWTSISQSVETTVTSGNDLRLKIINDTGTYVWPTAWASWGGDDVASMTLTKISLAYTI